MLRYIDDYVITRTTAVMLFQAHGEIMCKDIETAPQKAFHVGVSSFGENARVKLDSTSSANEDFLRCVFDAMVCCDRKFVQVLSAMFSETVKLLLGTLQNQGCERRMPQLIIWPPTP